MKKRTISLILIFAFLVTLSVPAGAISESSPDSEGPNTIKVVFNNGFHLIDSSTSVNSERGYNLSNEIVFEKDHLVFYKTHDTRFSPDFKLVLQEDGTVIPVDATVIDLNSENPASVLTDEYGYSEDSAFVAEIESLIAANGSNISKITAYTTPNVKSDLLPEDYTKPYKGRTLTTEFLEVEGASGSLHTVVEHGKNGVEDYDDMCQTKVAFNGYTTYAISEATVLSFLGKALLNAFIDEWKNPSTYTKDTIKEYMTYTNILRYTNVVYGGSIYLGCISNCVYADLSLYYCPVGAGQSGNLKGVKTVSEYYESDHYPEDDAFEAAYNNYLNVPIVDRIEHVEILVTYPSGRHKTIYETIFYA